MRGRGLKLAKMSPCPQTVWSPSCGGVIETCMGLWYAPPFGAPRGGVIETLKSVPRMTMKMSRPPRGAWIETILALSNCISLVALMRGRGLKRSQPLCNLVKGRPHAGRIETHCVSAGGFVSGESPLMRGLKPYCYQYAGVLSRPSCGGVD